MGNEGRLMEIEVFGHGALCIAQSGRCWMFAALNTFRHKMLNQFNLKEFELSRNYTFFLG